jgi:hypothetical protein
VCTCSQGRGKCRLKIVLLKSCYQVPKNDVKILLGDFNAKVGLEDQEKSVVGKCVLHVESDY